jgi:hypothetical protein
MEHIMKTAKMLGLALPLFAVGCAESQAQQVKEARLQQVEDRADANSDAVKDQQNARTGAIDAQANSHDRSVASANRPDEKPTRELVGVEKDRALYRSNTQAKLDTLAVRINEAQQKLTVLGPRAPTALHTELQTAVKEHDMLKRQIDGLDDTSPIDWDRTTKSIDEQLSALGDRVSQLSDSIGKV